MKISKGLILDLCRIAAILMLILCIVLWFNQKPNFSKYHSYEVVTDNGDIPLTDEQFQKIVELYKNDETMQMVVWNANTYCQGYHLRLYKTADRSGDYLTVYTGSSAPVTSVWLLMGNKWFRYDEGRGNVVGQIEAIIEEAIEQSESEREL